MKAKRLPTENRCVALLETLPEAVQCIHSSPNLPRAVAQTCAVVARELEAQAVFVLWYSESERAFIGMPPGFGIDDATLSQIRLPAGACVASDYAFVHGKPYLSDRADEEELLSSALRRQLQLKRLLTVPIRDENQTRGVLYVVNSPRTGRAEAEVAFTSVLAQACGTAISLLHYRHHIERAAITDPLTGLFNRYHLETLLEEHIHLAVQNHAQLSVAVVYLDHLKYINDTYGYRVGDRALIAVAEALQHSVHPRALLARYAGDEFVALLPGTTLREAHTQMQMVRDLITLQEWHPVGSLSVSIGVVNYPESAIPVQQLLCTAEDAAAAAKRHGRNQVVLVTPRNVA